MRGAVVLVGLLMVGGCAAQEQPPSPPLKLAVAAPKSEAAQPSQVRDAINRHQQSGSWPVYRTPGYVLYPYDEGPQPVLDCAPLRTTDIQLEAGETIPDVAMGDTERWMATPASS